MEDRGHDEPADLPSRLRAAEFVQEEQATVLIGLTTQMAADQVVPEGVGWTPRRDSLTFSYIWVDLLA